MLVAGLPGDLAYVGKAELAKGLIWRFLFKRFGIAFVDRFDAQRGVEDTARVLGAVQQGRTAVFFPEGTFGREPGLRYFRMGASIVAAQAGVPVVPVGIRGTRSFLRKGQWFPRRATVRVSIGAPLFPQGTEWKAAIELRDKARVEVLSLCGEPDSTPALEADL
jgi:1-acyl-sn-glycerol-3-phosphate acyltransferase